MPTATLTYPATDTTQATERTCNPIDTYAEERIRYRARCLRRAFGLNWHDEEDLRSRFMVRLLQAAGRFDPDKASWRTYLNRVLDREYRHLARELRTRSAHPEWCPARFSEMTNGDKPQCEHEFCDEPPPDRRDADLRLDIEAALESMPDLLRSICEELKHFTPTETARRLEIHRGLIYRLKPHIREHFIAAGIDS